MFEGDHGNNIARGVVRNPRSVSQIIIWGSGNLRPAYDLPVLDAAELCESFEVGVQLGKESALVDAADGAKLALGKPRYELALIIHTDFWQATF